MYFEKVFQLPPLATRIFALLMLCPRSGHSFDEIVELSKSSKSSVSTNLNLLLNRGNIEYFTKTGDRKRYFRLSKAYLKVSLKHYEKQLAEELSLLKKVENFNKTYNKVKYEKHRAIGILYKEYLEARHENLVSTINKMNQIEKQDI